MDRHEPTIGRRSVLKSTIAAIGAAGVAGKATADSTDLVVSADEPGTVSNSTLALRGSVDELGGVNSVDVLRPYLRLRIERIRNGGIRDQEGRQDDLRRSSRRHGQ